MAEISSNKAKRIINQALAKGKELGLQPLSVIIFDAGFVLELARGLAA